MMQSFKHKGLELFFITGRKSVIQAKHVKRLQLFLGCFNVATSPDDMSSSGLFLPPLTGSRAKLICTRKWQLARYILFKRYAC